MTVTVTDLVVTDVEAGGTFTVDKLSNGGGASTPAVTGTTGTYTSGTASVGSLALPLPTGYSAGDVLFCVVAAGGSAGSLAIGFPAGWTEIGEAQTTADDHHSALARRVAVGSAADGGTITLGTGTHPTVAACWAQAAADQTSAVVDEFTSVVKDTSGASTSTDGSGEATDFVDDLIYGMFSYRYAAGEAGGTMTAPAGWSELADVATSRTGSNPNVSLHVYVKGDADGDPQASATAVNVANGTHTGNTPVKAVSLGLATKKAAVTAAANASVAWR
jgi:hypothetical protein